MTNDTFDVLFLIARPAAGKSEIIDYLKHTLEATRRELFHIGPFTELDDFPLIWQWFDEDEILERLGQPRLHSDHQGYFLHTYQWHVLIERLGLAYNRLLRDPHYHDEGRTVLVEFARGAEHGGFREAFRHVPLVMLRRGAILYIDVSWEESLRKNRARANPDAPDSILQHSLSDEKMARLYRDTDWPAFSAGDPAYITIGSGRNGERVPYAVFPNDDDVTTAVTTARGDALGARLAETLDVLWQRYAANRFS
jgi:hypothetical protein